jgi:virulence-associated protein VapD
MAQYAIAFDLDTSDMKADGMTDAQITSVYQSEVPKALAAAGFTEHPQGSVYHTLDVDSLVPVVRLQTTLLSTSPNFCKYSKAVHIFRMEGWSEITALLKP